MESKSSSSSSVYGPQKASNQDEIFMQQSLLFSDTLKELKNLRKQLNSAAEYFEASYSQEDHKHIVVESLKEYAKKALINTIDHLGSVAFKVNSLVDRKIGEVSEMELHFCCLEQRVQTCQKYVDQGGLSQQLLMIGSPKYHKRYVFPDEETIDTKPKHHWRSFRPEINSYQFKNVVQTGIRVTSPTVIRERDYRSQSPQLTTRQRTFTFNSTPINKRPDKRTASPQKFPFMRSGSLVPKRSISPNYPETFRRKPSETQRSVSLSKFAERKGGNDIEQYSSKSKRLFKALLSMRKSRKDSSLYNYLDEA